MMLAGIQILALCRDIAVLGEIDRRIHGRIPGAEAELALDGERLGRLHGEEHQDLLVLVVHVNGVGLGELHRFSIGGDEGVIGIFGERFQHRIADLGQLVLVQLQIAVLVVIHHHACRKHLVETPDIAHFLNGAVRPLDDFHAGFGKDVRMRSSRDGNAGEAGREEQKASVHYPVCPAFES
ncbi:hypothetical protein D3C86_1630000 [compost metagenome]